MLRVDGATPVTRGRTTCVLECAAHRARDRDIHAAITRSVVGRRVAGHYPCRRADSNNTDDNADRYQHGAAFARCGRVGRGGLASVDRRRTPSCGELDRSTVNGFPGLVIGFPSLDSAMSRSICPRLKCSRIRAATTVGSRSSIRGGRQPFCRAAALAVTSPRTTASARSACLPAQIEKLARVGLARIAATGRDY